MDKPKKLKPGRQPEISEAKIAVIVEALKKCCPKTVAVKAARVSYTAFKNWMNRGRNAWAKAKENPDKVKPADKLYVSLMLQVNEALGETIRDNLARIQTAGAEDWRAAAWLVERQDPENFGVNRTAIQEMARTIKELERQITAMMAAGFAVPEKQPDPKPEEQPKGA